MSAERCPECGAGRTGCGCAPSTGYHPLRIRPYISLADSAPAPATPAPAPADDPATQVLPPAPPAPGPWTPAAGPAYGELPGDGSAGTGTPAYGTSVPGPGHTPGHGPDHGVGHGTAGAGAVGSGVPWGGVPAYLNPAYDGSVPTGAPVPPGPPGPPGPQAWGGSGASGPPDETVVLQPVPSYDRHRKAAARRRRGMPLLAGAAAALVIGGAVVALGTSTGDGAPDADLALPDPKLSGAAQSVAPVGPSASAAGPSDGPTASRRPSRGSSPSHSASATASDGASPKASASPSASTGARSAPGPGPSTGSRPPSPSQDAPDGTLREGDSGWEVRQLQEDLARVRYFKGRPDGQYTGKTRDAVARFQRDRHVTGDARGVFGPATRAALEEALDDSYDDGYDGWDW
ncbi:peptidoglycan-binding protein [Streptomyces sp. NPDC089799]|uniref:peptidoglycan-binding protein n=1 Tax=Streptomyces sp. NPDC089799 TaxID=3155066 RepID=UPI0034200C1A